MIKSNEGYLQDRVRWGDIDGDGRADYLVIDDGGNILAWRNSGTSKFSCSDIISRQEGFLLM